MMSAHPGFKAVARHIAQEGHYTLHSAQAILAKKSREASPHAVKANPRLKRVKGGY